MKGKERAGPEGSLLEGKGLIKQQRAAVAASLHPVSEEQQMLADRHLSPRTCSSEKWKELWAGLFWVPGDLCCYDI